jgi:hypothetical protein
MGYRVKSMFRNETYRTVVVSGTWSINPFPFRIRRKNTQLSTLPHTHACHANNTINTIITMKITETLNI